MLVAGDAGVGDPPVDGGDDLHPADQFSGVSVHSIAPMVDAAMLRTAGCVGWSPAGAVAEPEVADDGGVPDLTSCR